MKQFTILLIVGLLFPALAKPAEPNQKSLNDVPFNLKDLQSEQTRKYKWMFSQSGSEKELKDYAVLVISSKFEKDGLLLHDTITLVPSSENEGMVFERSIKYPKDNLLRPEQITLDITGEGKTVREMSYENGEMKILNDLGPTIIQHPKFDDGILTFNALLRLAPLLPRDIGKVYTFRMYAEPFLFRIREMKETNDSFTITCEAPETVKIGEKSYKCVKFRMELKSAQIRTDVWVGDNNLVVKYADISLNDMDPYCLEATLQE
jgi:hypothetical protein